MSDATLDETKRRYESSRRMLATLEEALEPIVDDSVALSNLDLEARYVSCARTCAGSLCDDSPRDAQRRAYDAIFEEALDRTSGPSYGDPPEPERVCERLVEYLEWIANLEAQIGDVGGDRDPLEGLTAELADTILEIGRQVADRAGEDSDAERKIDGLRRSLEPFLDGTDDR